jgi:hypothetical protein
LVGAVEKAKSLRDMVVPKTLANFLDRKTQLYEQGATVKRIRQYVRNWWRWVRAGVVLGSEGMVEVLHPPPERCY